jgi:cell wall-associated NlpC family hydrolase
MFGVTVPRDAHDQAAATTPLSPGQERPGDLYFFARPGQQIHHVGFVVQAPNANSRYILHADSDQGMVVLEELSPAHTAMLVGAHRVRV